MASAGFACCFLPSTDRAGRLPGEVADQDLTLGIRVSRLGSKSFDLEYLLVRDADGKAIARGRSVQVMFDYRTKQTVPIDEGTRLRLIAFEGRGPLREG